MNIRQRAARQVALLIVMLLLVPAGRSQNDNNRALFRFVIYGDTRTHHNVHRQVVRAAIEQHPEFIVQTGDLVAKANNPAQWRKFGSIIQPVRENRIGYYPARGNHDVGNRASMRERFQRRFNPETSSIIASTFHNLRFLALDTESDLSINSDQYQSLEKELKDASADKKFVIPFFHEAIFSVGSRHGSNTRLQAVLHPLFKQYGVKLVFQGHDHIYYRTTRDGIVYVVTGGGGAPLYGIVSSMLQAGDVAKQIHHFCVADVFQDEIKIAVYAVARKGNGLKTIDNFVVPITSISQ
ncbi:MAG TPA: metallophosphoesterase [Terriglobales bacterium]